MIVAPNPPPTPPPPPVLSRPPRRTVGQIVLLFWAIVLPLCVIVFAARLFYGNVTPNLVLPPIQGPNPNAYDLFVQAGKQAGANESDLDAIGGAVTGRAKKPLSHQEKTALVAKYAPTLALVRQGFDLPYRDMSGPRSYETTFPQYEQFRHLAWLMVLEGEVKRENGDMRGAAQNYADCIVFGHTLVHGAPPLIGYLSGAACEAIGRKPLWKITDKLDAQTARDISRRINTACFNEHIGEDYAQTVEEEGLWQQAGLMKIFRATNGSPMFAWRSKQTIIDDNRRYMERLAANARKPYPLDKTLPPEPRDMLNQILLPVFDKGRYKSAANDTQNALLVTALALRAYRAEHNNAAPPNLSALAPAYLPKLPNDPLSYPVAPLCYRVSGGQSNAPVLYSVGPDNKNDNGAPIADYKTINGTTNGRSRYITTSGSKGDTVAGINTQ